MICFGSISIVPMANKEYTKSWLMEAELLREERQKALHLLIHSPNGCQYLRLKQVEARSLDLHLVSQVIGRGPHI